MYYSHSYTDPDTGQLVDVMVDDLPRNAVIDHRRPPARAPSSGSRTVPPRRPSGGAVPPRERGTTAHTPVYVPQGRAPVRQVVHTDDDQLVVNKSAIVELIPAVGQVWASFLGLPEQPKATGSDVTDRNNAALHRDALARHQQSQTRILALTMVAERMIGLLSSR